MGSVGLLAVEARRLAGIRELLRGKHRLVRPAAELPDCVELHDALTRVIGSEAE